MLQDFQSVSDHFGTLYIIGLNMSKILQRSLRGPTTFLRHCKTMLAEAFVKFFRHGNNGENII